jgi:hypothetical protein
MRQFSQSAARKQVTAAPGIGGVDHHDIEVASQLQVLKAIIQNKHIGIQSLDCPPSGRCSISITNNRSNTEQLLGEQEWFVARLRSLRQHRRAVRD